jgi:penicillin amidase
MRLIKRILMGLLIVVVLLGLGVFVWLKSKVANHDQEINLQGLSQPVEVLWDDFGIPHIYAQTEEDAYFALGYVHAQERLFQMEALRRLADGRLSEYLAIWLWRVISFLEVLVLENMLNRPSHNILKMKDT